MRRVVFLTGLLLLLSTNYLSAREDIVEVFKNNSAIIYTINIRNFGAFDKDNDGIIDESKGDIKGTFLNAKDKLKALKEDGINTIYILPITPVGRLKALGTSGSLYAMDAFDKINPELDDTTNDITVYEEAKEFVQEAHKLDLNVIIDLPSCGSYDLSLRKPDWFILDKNNDSVIPADWSDVRLFRIYDKDKNLNKLNLDNFKSFVDMAKDIGFDGIRADVAAIKPPEFWAKVINYARKDNKKFLFLAEANPEWTNPAPVGVKCYSSIEELLSSGFDSYYGSWSDFKNVKTKKEFDKKIDKNLKILKKYKDKSMIAAIATHDQQAPVLRAENYWRTVLWLNATLPLNSYFLDGFSYGDNFIYPYENKKADKSSTDDEYYFVHTGMFDIFNPTAQTKKLYPKLKEEYLKAIDFKIRNQDLITNGKYKALETNNSKVFAYSIVSFDRELIVIGSLDEDSIQKASVKSKYLKKDYLFRKVNSKNNPTIRKNIINVTLEPLEIQVYLISLAKFRAM